MRTFVTSDLHFGHTNIMKYCPNTRPYRDVNHMDTTMVLDWNALIRPEDQVYILGDVAFSSGERAVSIVKRLNGRKILIKGNHDQKNLRDPAFKACFEQIYDYLELRYNGNNIVMFHYPIQEWNRCHHGSIHFHGHCHGTATGLEQYRILDVGCDATQRIAVQIEELIAVADAKLIKGHH